MKLAAIADRVARDIYTRPINHHLHTDFVIRDACDLATWGELPPRTLDRLCDMVRNRLFGDRFFRWRMEEAHQTAERTRKRAKQ